MPQYLRSVRRGRWERPKWLQSSQEEVQADALQDLATENNILSVYLAESQQDIDHIVIALAATRDNPQNVDFAVFSDAGFQEAEIEVIEAAGETADSRVNELHRDLGKLTAQQLLTLAGIVAHSTISRRSRGSIRRGIQDFLATGLLNSGAVNPKLLTNLR